jgi:hypothetical protein
MLSVYAECDNTILLNNAICAVCHKPKMSRDIMLSVIIKLTMLSVVMLCVIMVIVVAPTPWQIGD